MLASDRYVLCEKARGMEKGEAHKVYKHYAKMASRYALGPGTAEDLSPNGIRGK